MKLPQNQSFFYFLTWNLPHILSNLKTFQKWKKLFEYYTTFFNDIIIYKKTFDFQCEFKCLFYNSTFVLTFIMGIIYFILAWRDLKTIKLQKRFFSSHLDKAAIQNNPLIKLHLTFHKTVNRKNWKSQNFRVMGLVLL